MRCKLCDRNVLNLEAHLQHHHPDELNGSDDEQDPDYQPPQKKLKRVELAKFTPLTAADLNTNKREKRKVGPTKISSLNKSPKAPRLAVEKLKSPKKSQLLKSSKKKANVAQDEGNSLNKSPKAPRLAVEKLKSPKKSQLLKSSKKKANVAQDEGNSLNKSPKAPRLAVEKLKSPKKSQLLKSSKKKAKVAQDEGNSLNKSPIAPRLTVNKLKSPKKSQLLKNSKKKDNVKQPVGNEQTSNTARLSKNNRNNKQSNTGNKNLTSCRVTRSKSNIIIELSSNKLITLKPWAKDKVKQHRPRRINRRSIGEHPKRRSFQCPECPLEVQDLSRHLRIAHDYSRDSSREYVFAHRHLFREDKMYWKCPVAGCSRVVQSLPKHLRQMHDLEGAESRDVSRRKLPANYTSSEEDEVEVFMPPLSLNVDSIHERGQHHGNAASQELAQITESETQPSSLIEENADTELAQTTESETQPSSLIEENADTEIEETEWYKTWVQHPVLRQYYKWLIGVDGGKSNKVAVETCRLIFKIWKIIDVKMELKSIVDSNLIKKRWLNDVYKTVQPGTSKSWISTLREFYNYLRSEGDLPSKEGLVGKVLFESERWLKTVNKDERVRRSERMIEESESAIDPKDIERFYQSGPATAAKLRLENVSQGDKVEKFMYLEMRNFLILALMITNGQRAGAIAGITMRSFRYADERNESFIMGVAHHKTARISPVTLVLSRTMHKWLKNFVKYARATLPNMSEELQLDKAPLFLTYPKPKEEPCQMSTSLINNAINTIWLADGGERICGTKIRKATTTNVRAVEPGVREVLAAHMTHSASTADRYYLLNQRKEDSVRVVNLVKRVMNITEDITPAPLQEPEQIDIIPAPLQEPEQIDIIPAPLQEPEQIPLASEQMSSDDLKELEELEKIEATAAEKGHPDVNSSPEKPQCSKLEIPESSKRAFNKEDAKLLINLCFDIVCCSRDPITEKAVMAKLQWNAQGSNLLKRYKALYPDEYKKKITDRVRCARRADIALKKKEKNRKKSKKE